MIEIKSGIRVITELREYATCFTIRLRHVLIAERNGWRMLMAAPNREPETLRLRLLKSEVAAVWADVSHALWGFYELADILIVLDEVLFLEVSNLARQLKFNPKW